MLTKGLPTVRLGQRWVAEAQAKAGAPTSKQGSSFIALWVQTPQCWHPGRPLGSGNCGLTSDERRVSMVVDGPDGCHVSPLPVLHVYRTAQRVVVVDCVCCALQLSSGRSTVVYAFFLLVVVLHSRFSGETALAHHSAPPQSDGNREPQFSQNCGERGTCSNLRRAKHAAKFNPTKYTYLVQVPGIKHL